MIEPDTAGASIPAGTAPGWYADPSNPGAGRWYDGTTWTSHVYLVAPAAPSPSARAYPSAGAPATGGQTRHVAPGLILIALGLMFCLGPLSALPGASSAGEAVALVVFVLIGAAVLVTGTLSIFAPERVHARFR
jgi:hypothetical protein